MDFSPAHVGAFHAWQQSGCSLAALSDDQLQALGEDVGFARDIGAERIRRLTAAAPAAPTPAAAPRVPKVSGMDAERLASAIAEGIFAAVKPLQARITELEQRVPEFKGVWEPARTYARGSLVMYQGSSWFAVAATDERPGDGVTGWKILAHAGRAGRDGRDGKDFR